MGGIPAGTEVTTTTAVTATIMTMAPAAPAAVQAEIRTKITVKGQVVLTVIRMRVKVLVPGGFEYEFELCGYLIRLIIFIFRDPFDELSS